MFYADRVEVNEQIAVALVRLQQDMQSVLTRLNTLEALSVAQTRIRSRTPSENERERQAQVSEISYSQPCLIRTPLIYSLGHTFESQC